MKKIVIIDYGCGNILSLQRALSKVKFNSILTREINEIETATHLILPGVGAFGNAMDLLKKYELIDSIKNHHYEEKPLLGICLGMQLLLSKSYEFGIHDGLNLIDGIVEKIFTEEKKVKIPHIGWSQVQFEHELEKFKNFNEKNFYFVHSFIAKTFDAKNTIAYTNLLGLKIPSIIKKKIL